MEEQTVKQEPQGILAQIIAVVIVGIIALCILFIILGEYSAAGWAFVLSVPLALVLYVAVDIKDDPFKQASKRLEAEKEAKEEAVKRCPLLQKIQEEEAADRRRKRAIGYVFLNMGS